MKEEALRSVLTEGSLSSHSILEWNMEIPYRVNRVSYYQWKKGMEAKEITSLHEMLEEAKRNTQEDTFKLERKSTSAIHKLKGVTLNTESICFSLMKVHYIKILCCETYSFEI